MSANERAFTTRVPRGPYRRNPSEHDLRVLPVPQASAEPARNDVAISRAIHDAMRPLVASHRGFWGADPDISYCVLLFPFGSVVPTRGAMLRPTRLCGASKHLAPFFGADVAPARGPQANGLPAYRGAREFSTRQFEHFQREIEHRLDRQFALSNDASKHHGAPDAEG
jgi:hypothetical protein